jgi:hypothetical protein
MGSVSTIDVMAARTLAPRLKQGGGAQDRALADRPQSNRERSR